MMGIDIYVTNFIHLFWQADVLTCWLLRRSLTLKDEGSDSGGGVRDPAAPAHPERPQTAGGVLQQTHPAAPGGGAGDGEEELQPACWRLACWSLLTGHRVPLCVLAGRGDPRGSGCQLHVGALGEGDESPGAESAYIIRCLINNQ